MKRPPFPAAIDNTIRSTFKACNRKGMIRHLLHWDIPQQSVHLHAGMSFAHGLAATRLAYYRDDIPAQEAVELGWQALIEHYGDFDHGAVENKSAHRMGEALVLYFEEYPLAMDIVKPAMFHNQPAVEFNFGIPLPIPHPETGEPIIYCGRFDMLGEANGQLFVVDEKTTGSLGQYWARRYELSAQFTGYCWAAQQHGYPAVGAIIRGIGILSKEIKFASMPLQRPQFLIDEWYRQLLVDVRRMIQMWLETDWEGVAEPDHMWQRFDPDFNDACGGYGGCQYLPVCQTQPSQREKLLEINFVKRAWEPLKGVSDE